LPSSQMIVLGELVARIERQRNAGAAMQIRNCSVFARTTVP
jgi:hypothetical protein